MTSNHLLLYRLAELMLEYEQNILSVDSLFDDEQIGAFVKSIQIDSPYQQMLLDGVLTESVQANKLYVSFTTEGLFHYILGEVISEKNKGLGAAALKQLMNANKLNGLKQGVEQCLIRDVEDGYLDRLEWLIDNGSENNDLCTLPLKVYLKKHGAPSLIKSLMSLPTSNDWIALDKLDEHLEDLAQEILRKNLHDAILPYLHFERFEEIKYGLVVLKSVNTDLQNSAHTLVNTKKIKLTANFNLLSDLGEYYMHIGKFKKAENILKYNLRIQQKNVANQQILAKCHYDIGRVHSNNGEHKKSLKHFLKCLNIELAFRSEYDLEIAGLYNDIGLEYTEMGEVSKSFHFLNLSLDIRIKILGETHPYTAISYLNLSRAYRYLKEFDKALTYLERCHFIEQKTLGHLHPSFATTLNNFGHLYFDLKEFDRALDYYKNCLQTRINTLGQNHIKTAQSYKLISTVYVTIGEFKLSLYFLEKCLSIEISLKESTNEDISSICFDVGKLCFKLKKYRKAIEHFKLGFSLNYSGGFPFQIAKSYEQIGDLRSALDNYLLAAQIRRNLYGDHDEDTMDAFNNVDRIKKILNISASADNSKDE